MPRKLKDLPPPREQWDQVHLAMVASENAVGELEPLLENALAHMGLLPDGPHARGLNHVLTRMQAHIGLLQTNIHASLKCMGQLRRQIQAYAARTRGAGAKREPLDFPVGEPQPQGGTTNGQ